MTSKINLFKVVTASFLPSILILSTFILAGRVQVENVKKQQYVALMSESLQIEKIDRKLVLTKFFEKYHSPLKDHVDTFLSVADKYNIDYRLLPAISCIESTCGKKLIPGSYNPFGWGIYGNKVTRFASYDEAIEVVGKGLNKNYFAKGYDTPEEIAPIYTPPAHDHWLRSVRYFISVMNAIQDEVKS